MPLREDLLTPIAGENPSGLDLYYDRVFDQIKEARREDSDDLPGGVWEAKEKKKADHRAVIKLAGEALATKSKDLRLLGWLVESHLKIDGLSVLVPGIELLHALQEAFWPTFYPPIEEGDDLELRMLSVEAAARLMIATVRKLPLTKSGLSYEDYLESRALGYEKDATTDAKKKERKEAIDKGKLTAEDFDHEFALSPKSLYLETTATLAEAIQAVERLDEYGREAYGENSPNLLPFKDALAEIHLVSEMLLNERRKTEPDPVEVVEEPAADAENQAEPSGETASETQAAASSGEPAPRRAAKTGDIRDAADAYAMVVESAEFLYAKDPKSPVPYLVCAGLRLGETRMQGANPAPGFAVGPTSQIRQSLRSLANNGAWKELLRASLPILASECARAWLDLHRYIWRAGQETGAEAISVAVVGTVKNLLLIRPELRYWTLEDDTGAANPETQQWLDATILK